MQFEKLDREIQDHDWEYGEPILAVDVLFDQDIDGVGGIEVSFTLSVHTGNLESLRILTKFADSHHQIKHSPLA